MTAELAGWVAGGVVTLAALWKAGPNAWRFICAAYKLPLHMAEMVEQLRGLDEVKDAANEARAEWRGATQAVTDLADGHERRLKKVERRLDDLDGRMDRAERA